MWGLATGMVLILFVGLVVRGADSTPERAPAMQLLRPAPPPAAPRSHAEPNIVFILTDDLSWNLINPRIAPHIVALERRGVTFNHYFVADSLCCPSRATIFTGDYPHDTGVYSNGGAAGGYRKFKRNGLTRRTFAVALRRQGYATSMLGKYLNGYGGPVMNRATAPVPRGWSDWHVSNNTGYDEFDYLLDDNGHINRYGGPTAGCAPGGPAADYAVAGNKQDHYGVAVLGRDATRFITRSAGRPFAVELATFAPHKPYTPAPQNACDFPQMIEPRNAAFDAANVNPPAWLGQRAALSPGEIGAIDRHYRMRAQQVEAIDATLARIETKLRAEHLMKKTYIVFSSDNGYHMGEHRLLAGKQTAFDTDIRVPLIVAGPGIPKGRVVREMAQNTDLDPTFVQLAHGTPSPSIDGHSLVSLLRHPGRPRRWPTLALVEHLGRARTPSDPDFDTGKLGGDPTTYDALRISSPRLPHFHGHVEAVYVEYRDAAHEREFYDMTRDPYELRNIAGRLTRPQRRELHRLLVGLETCHDARACWKAGLPRRVRPATRLGA